MTSSTSCNTPTMPSTKCGAPSSFARADGCGHGERQTLAAVEQMGQPDGRQAPRAEPTLRSQPESVQGLHPQREPGPAVDVPLRRRDAELPATVDRSTPVAASGPLPETGADVAGSPRRHSELLPEEGATGGRGSREWEHQVTTAPRMGIQEPALSAIEVPAHGGDQNRIRGLQESGLKCGSRRIPAESPEV